MSKTITVITVLLMLFSGHSGFAFDKEKDFRIEPVKKSDLSDKPFRDYPEAKAKILFDIGQLLIQPEGDHFSTSFSRHLRLKYLGDTVLSPYLLNMTLFNGAEKAVLYTLINNKIEVVDITSTWNELDKVKPFSETLKQLKSGDILEFKFHMDIPSPHIVPGWQFEYEIPVNWSELKAEVPDIFIYRPVFKGYIPLLINNGEIKLDENGNWIEGDGYYIYSYRFAIGHIPPFKKVPFSPSSRDYLTAVDFYLEKVKGYKGIKTVQGKSWGELTTALTKADKLGKRIDEADLKPFIEQMNLPEDLNSKVGGIYYWLKNRMTWNGEWGIVAERPLIEVFESKTGSVAELNLLLVAFLRQSGVEAAPVILRTVELGELNMSLPQISQFNYLVAYTRLSDYDVLMDISEPCLEPGILKVSCLNGKGLKINPRFEEWIDLEGKKKAANRITIQLSIKGDSLTGVAIEHRKNYFAFDDCVRFNEGKEIVKVDSALKILDISYANMDSLIYGNTIRITFDATSLMKENDQTLSMSPFMFERFEENPFTEKARTYPIVFSYFFDYTWNFTISLPEGYKLSNLPKSETIATPDNSIRFIYSAKQLSNIIQVTAQITMLKKKFPPEIYDGLKTFYKEVIKKMEEPIKIKKI